MRLLQLLYLCMKHIDKEENREWILEENMERKTIGFIGLGNMAKAIIGGLLKNGFEKEQIIGSAKTEKTLLKVKNDFGIMTCLDNKQVAKQADIVVLAVKPQMIDGVLKEIGESLKEDVIVISILAGKTISYLENGIGRRVKMARCMPNVASLVGEGCTAVCYNKECEDWDKPYVTEILESIGMVKEVSENLMDAVIGASGSSPAFVFMMIEAMADAVVKAGMRRDLAYEMVAQAVLGSAKLFLESETALGEKMHPAQLKDMVCSPGGTTIEGVKALEEGGFRGVLMEAVEATIAKSKLL